MRAWSRPRPAGSTNGLIWVDVLLKVFVPVAPLLPLVRRRRCLRLVLEWNIVPPGCSGGCWGQSASTNWLPLYVCAIPTEL